MYCKKCGKQIADDSRFCLYCGTKLFGDETPQQPEQTTQSFYEAPKKTIAEDYASNHFTDDEINQEYESFEAPKAEKEFVDYRELKRQAKIQKKAQRQASSQHEKLDLSYNYNPYEPMPANKLLNYLSERLNLSKRRSQNASISIVLGALLVVYVIVKLIVLKIGG